MNLFIAFLTAVTLTVHIKEADPHGEMAIGTCSAVLISPTEALSANHCYHKGLTNIWVKDSEGRSFEAVVEKQDKLTDLALLRIKCPPHLYTDLGKPVNRGDNVYVLSSENDMPGTYSQGIVNNIILDSDSNMVMVVHSNEIIPGASGSGLFDRKGHIVGINNYTIKNLSFASDVSTVQYFLTNTVR